MGAVSDRMSIGDFARRTGLTPKALRLYDELGLLVPVEVDALTGYRWYAAGQLERARLVASLRLVGMPLARIRPLLDLPPEEAAAELEAYWRQVEADTASRRRVVRTLVQQLRIEETSMITPTTAPLHAETGVSLRQGGRERQQDAVIATADTFGIADGFGERDDLAAAALDAFLGGGFEAALAAAATGGPETGTTLTVVRLAGGRARITHVGDGRVHLVRDDEVTRLTRDHTMVAALVEAGELTEEEARSHPHRALINRALAGTPVVPDETGVDLRPGDRLVLTTDGVHSVLADDLLADLITADAGPQRVADALAAAVEDAGAPDNHGVVVVDVS